MSESGRKFNFSTLLAIGSVLISSTALVISLLSYRLNLSNFEAERKAVFLGKIDSNQQFIELYSVDDKVFLLSSGATFPRELAIGYMPIDPPQLRLELTPLKNWVMSNNPLQVKNGQGRKTLLVPLILDSYYIAKGERFRETALYGVGMDCSINPSDGKFDIAILGLFPLNERIDNPEQAKQRVEKVWQVSKKPE